MLLLLRNPTRHLRLGVGQAQIQKASGASRPTRYPPLLLGLWRAQSPASIPTSTPGVPSLDTLAIAYLQALFDTILLSEGVSGSYWLNLADALSLGPDSVTNSVSLSKSDTLSISEATALLASLNQADTLLLSEAVTKTFTKARADAINPFGDSFSQSVGLNRADSILLVEAIHKALGLVTGDSLSLSDTDNLHLFIAALLTRTLMGVGV